MEISFENLNEIDFNINKIFAMKQQWAENSNFVMNRPRPTDALVFFAGCDASIDISDYGCINVKKGSLCFIPHGKTYAWHFFNNSGTDKVSTMLFEFVINDAKGNQLEFSDDVKIADNVSFDLYYRLFSETVNEFSRPKISFPLLKSCGFSLIANASETICKKSFLRQKFVDIYNGIKYLENDPSQDKSISEIAKMCGMGVNYFERLFKEYSGMSPSRYRMIRKINRAKIMLENPLLTIEQISDELNYTDCAYFCKCFKKLTGTTAGEYRTVKINSVLH